MKAFVERLCDHVGIVRAGPDAEKYGDPYDGSVTFMIDGKNAVIKGFATKHARGNLTIAHVRASLKAIEADGLTPKWERIKQEGSL